MAKWSPLYEDTSDDSDEGFLVEGREIHVEVDIYNKCLALAFDFDIDNFTLKISMKLKFVCSPNSIPCVESSPTQYTYKIRPLAKNGMCSSQNLNISIRLDMVVIWISFGQP